MCRICIRMWHSHLNDMEIPETKRFTPKWFELGTTSIELADWVYLSSFVEVILKSRVKIAETDIAH